MFISVLLNILFLLVIPILFGAAVVSLIGIDKGLINSYVTGFLTMMAICELIAVPCAFFKMSFTVVVIVFFVVVTAAVLWCGIKKQLLTTMSMRSVKTRLISYSIIEYIALAIMLIVFCVIIVNSIQLYSIDQDDSRFIVSASDMLRTDKMFLADPNTGIVYSNWPYGVDAAKDIISPHAVFCAIMSGVTLTDTTLFMHSIYPIFLYVIALLIYYSLISELIEGMDSLKANVHKDFYKFLFLTVLFIITLFHYSTRNTREAVFLVRLWQGKAILAAIILPALLWILYRIHRHHEKGYYVLLFITSLAGCLTSSMATLLVPLVIGIYGLVYGIAKKSIRMSFCIWLSAVIPMILALLSLYIRNEMILC